MHRKKVGWLFGREVCGDASRGKSGGIQWGKHLGADDDALAAGGLLLVDVFVFGGAVGGVVGVAAAGAAAVELDAVTGARDTKALARAA